MWYGLDRNVDFAHRVMYIQYDVDSIYSMMWILDFKHMVYGMLLAIKKKKYKVGFYSSDDSDGRERAC